MILPGRENPRNCVDPDGIKMRWCLSTLGSPKYVLPVDESTYVTHVSPYTRRWSLTMYLEAVLGRVESGTLTFWSSQFGDALGGRDRVNSEMHLEAVTERVWRCNWRPRLSELRDALGGRVRVNSEMHLEAMIERVWRCTLRPWPSVFGDAQLGRDRASLEMHFEAAIERDWRSTWR